MMAKTWIEPRSVDVDESFIAAVGGHRLVAETLIRRGITTRAAANAFLDPEHYQPASPFELPGMQTAVERVWTALHQNEQICIWGDFDVDGQTATALLVTGLRALGGEVFWHIPSRADGHGMKLARLQAVLAENPSTKLIITCDTGIAEHESIAYAQAQGVDVIVTDHHHLPDTLPPAFVCVNPQMLPADHPLHTLPGVGCAYKLMEALTSAEAVASSLDLVALGIVADVAVQTGDARYLLQRGLAQLRQGNRLGLAAVCKVAELEPAKISEEQIGFVIAPRLNSLGRLGDANDGVTLLTTEDGEQAQILAYRVEALNNERRSLTQQIFEGAQQQVEDQPELLDYDALVLAHPRWVAGVLGIVANRLVEAYGRPVVLLVAPEAVDGDDAPVQLAHGSARSVAGCNITQAIATQSDLLVTYGGHTMAAGVTLAVDQIAAFRRGLSRAVRDQLGEAAGTLQPLLIDSYVALEDLSLALLAEINRLSPFGAGNPSLTLAARGLHLVDYRPLGRNDAHLRLTVSDAEGHLQEVVWWQADLERLPREGRFDLAFTVQENVYKGKTSLQVELVDLRQGEIDAALSTKRAKTPEIVDYRSVDDPMQQLTAVLQQIPDALIWNEGAALNMGGIEARRDGLKVAHTLVIWTAPPNSEVLQRALEIVRPEKVILFAETPTFAFLQQLSGLLKYAIRAYAGVVDIEQFAGLTAQTEPIVRTGIAHLVFVNNFRIVNETNDKLTLIQGEGAVAGRVKSTDERTQQQLEAMLKETAAFRAYFKTADAYNLLSSAF